MSRSEIAKFYETYSPIIMPAVSKLSGAPPNQACFLAERVARYLAGQHLPHLPSRPLVGALVFEDDEETALVVSHVVTQFDTEDGKLSCDWAFQSPTAYGLDKNCPHQFILADQLKHVVDVPTFVQEAIDCGVEAADQWWNEHNAFIIAVLDGMDRGMEVVAL